MTDEKDRPPFKPSLVFEGGGLIAIQIKKPKENADGNEITPSKTVLAFQFDTEDIEKYFGVLARLLRRDRPVAAGLAFVEQLELMARKESAEQNGHGPATGGLTPIEGGKGSKKKSRVKQPV